TVTSMFKKAKKHITNLRATISHEIDATTMKNDLNLDGKSFDRIIFNFPHAGFIGHENNKRVIEVDRILVRGFFKNASMMLSLQGEVHVTHKTTNPFNKWNLAQLANGVGLKLIETQDFHIEDYPGYRNKRGDGGKADKPFPLGESAKFKFAKIKA
ncbi:heavy metal-associated isoprenylated plant protein 41-like protein, partial [Tanacetum coccineum]